MDREKFCERLRQARLESGLKQESVAKFMNLPISAISIIESGSRKVDVFELLKLAELYNKPVEWFLNEGKKHQKRRWYDKDPLVAEAIALMQIAPVKYKKSTAHAIIGFLKKGSLVKE